MKVKAKELREVFSNSNIKADWTIASAVDDIYICVRTRMKHIVVVILVSQVF
jgi:hypothetical protein